METKENIIRNSEEIQNNEVIEDIEQIQNNEEIESDSNEKNIEIIKIDDNKKKYICVKCKKEYDEPQKFCGKCGKKVIEIKTKELQYICSKCGAQNKKEDVFCCNCGKRIKGLKVFSKLKALIIKNKKKFIIISGSVVLLIIIAIITVISIRNNKLKVDDEGEWVPGNKSIFDNNDTEDDDTEDDYTEDDYTEDDDGEKYTEEEEELYQNVLNGYGKIKEGLKDPDSLKIYGVRLYTPDDEYSYNASSSSDSRFIIYRITATNSFGGTVTNYYAYDSDTGGLVDDSKVLYDNGEVIDWDEVVEFSEYKYGD